MWSCVRYSKLILNINKKISRKCFRTILVHLFYTNTPVQAKKIKLATALENYTSDEKELLLSYINSASKVDLILHSNDKIASSIIADREKNGLYTDVNALLDINGFNKTQLKKLMLEAVGKMSSAKTDWKKSINSAVALYPTTFDLTWVHMSQERLLLNCNRILFPEESSKFSPTEMFETVMDMVIKLPSADIYLMPELRIIPNKKLNISVLYMFRLAMLQSYLIAALNPDFSINKTHRVLFINHKDMAIKLTSAVTKKKISCLDLLESIVNENQSEYVYEDHLHNQSIPANSHANSHGNFSVSQKFICSFLKENRVFREKYSKSVLMALSFFSCS